jgi:uncharacterized protein YjdB
VHVPEVTPAVAAIITLEAQVVVPYGFVATLEAIPVDAEGKQVPNVDITWESMNPTIVTVTGQGSVTAKGYGTTTVLAKAGGREAAIEVTVAPRPIPFP